MAGDNHNRRTVGEGDFLDARQGFEPVDAGQPDIQQHQIVGGVPQFFAACLARFYGVGLVALVLQHARERLADQRLVVDNQNPGGLQERVSAAESSAAFASRSLAASVGTSTIKRAPAGALSSTRMVAS